MYIVPAVKSDSAVTRGRGSGGLCTLWSKSYTKYVSKVECDSNRLQATQFDFPSGKFLLLNTYFMCDPRTVEFDEDPLRQLLEEIRTVITTSKCTNILIAGDLNASFERHSTFTEIIKDFFEELNLIIFWLNQENTPERNIGPVTYTHTHMRENMAYFSTLDHFVSSERVFNSVKESGVIYSADNPSAHAPIYTKLAVGQLDVSLEEEVKRKCPSWGKAQEDHKTRYKQELQKKLENITVPECIYQCRDVHCRGHREEIDDYCSDVLTAVNDAAWENLPTAGGGGKKEGVSQVAGWNELVKPFQDESKFWFSVWTSSGKPNTGDIFEMMRQTKNQYKYAVRRLKKAKDKIENDILVDSVMSGGGNIFDKVKQSRGQTKSYSSKIDGEVGSLSLIHI